MCVFHLVVSLFVTNPKAAHSCAQRVRGVVTRAAPAVAGASFLWHQLLQEQVQKDYYYYYYYSEDGVIFIHSSLNVCKINKQYTPV